MIKKIQDTFKQQIEKFEKKRKRRISKKNLHRHDCDNYKCRRKQLYINFSYFSNIKFIQKYKHIAIFTLVPVILFISIFIAYGPIFTVKSVFILPVDSITNRNLAYSSIENLYGKRLIEVEKNEVIKSMKQFQNNLKDVSISYNLPSGVNINLESYPVFFSTVVNEKPYFLTENGVLVPGKTESDFPILEIKQDFSKVLLPDYKNFFYKSDIQAILEAKNYLEENLLEISIENSIFYPVEKEIHFQIKDGPLLIYTLIRDLKQQIKKTSIFNTEHKSLQDSDIIYIDMRVDQKIYYCDSSEEYQCKQNLKKIYH